MASSITTVASSGADLVVQAPEIGTTELKALARLTGATAIEALARAENQAFRLVNACHRDEVGEFCAAAGYDCGFVPTGQRLERVRLVVMDMDSTLITIECVDELADMLGIKAQVSAITGRAMRGELDFRESLRERVALLAGLDVSALERVYAERLSLSPGAERMLSGFRNAGAESLLVSGGFTFFTERLQARLGLDYAVANTLEITDGKLTGRLLGDFVGAREKADHVERLGRVARAQGGIVVAIGDGANDLPMLARADVSVAYHAKAVVRSRTTYAIDHCGLDAVLNLFQ